MAKVIATLGTLGLELTKYYNYATSSGLIKKFLRLAFSSPVQKFVRRFVYLGGFSRAKARAARLANFWLAARSRRSSLSSRF